jgi:hypothetical protein
VSIRGEDKALPLEQVPSRFCPRRLKPGQVKRYMTVGPLVGYMVACPACGFIEMHMHEVAGFVEEEGKLVATTKPVGCMLCGRGLRAQDGTIEARRELPVR